MTKYRVAHIGGMRMTRDRDDSHSAWAIELRDTYGLTMFSISQIIETWEEYSETYAAGWLIPDKEGVEYAFGVLLEEVDEVNDQR